MTLKEIKTEFNLLPYDTTDGRIYIVYPQNGSYFRGYLQYLCSLYRKGKRYGIVNTDDLYSNLEDLKDGIEKYLKSLEFKNHYYNPMYRKGVFEDYVINDYLEERNFKFLSSFQHVSVYEYNGKNVYGGNGNKLTLSFVNLNNYFGKEIPETITVSLMTGEWSWVEKTCKREVHEIIKTIDSILKPLFVGDSIINLNQAEKFNTEKFMGELKQLNASNLEVVSVEYKDKLKKELTQLLDKL